ncbi:MAG: helix-turn-helix transcriptional regulator [Actinobacteria bacterium]|nr:MAG: helix-turn-helix transcriptional regulator [Actinomycetota bacterium]
MLTSFDRVITGRSYKQYCGIARALDLIGERWALLVIRELVFGPKRFTDLRQGLPGIATNVLSQRLHQLQRDGGGLQRLRADRVRRGARPDHARARPLGRAHHGRALARADPSARMARRRAQGVLPAGGRRGPLREDRDRSRRRAVHVQPRPGAARDRPRGDGVNRPYDRRRSGNAGRLPRGRSRPGAGRG